ERALDVADVRDEAHEAADLDGRGLVAAPERAVERDVPLHEGGPEGDRGPGGGEAGLVPRVADGGCGIEAAQRLHHAEVQLGDRARDGAGARGQPPGARAGRPRPPLRSPPASTCPWTGRGAVRSPSSAAAGYGR